MTTNQLFRECLAEIPTEVRQRLEFSFAIADKIVDLLKLKGVSNRDFAKKMRVSEVIVSKWLTGRYDFTLSQLSKISAFLGCPLISVSK